MQGALCASAAGASCAASEAMAVAQGHVLEPIAEAHGSL